MTTKTNSTLSILLATALLLPSCNYNIDVVTFESATVMPGTSKIRPELEIDNNLSFGLFGGKMRSKKPYDIHASYLDKTFTYASAVFTKVTVTYADGTVDPGIAALQLPLRAPYTPHESYNSMGDGVIAVHKSRMIFAEFPGTINRDEPFTIQIEGKFTKDNGKVIPFTIKEKYKIKREKGSATWVEFVEAV